MDIDEETGKPYVRQATCPECGTKYGFLADEWPEDCRCGYKFVDGDDEEEGDE